MAQHLQGGMMNDLWCSQFSRAVARCADDNISVTCAGVPCERQLVSANINQRHGDGREWGMPWTLESSSPGKTSQLT